jgi:prepilin-type N-terminal cleavage/methylation domain-containing protein
MRGRQDMRPRTSEGRRDPRDGRAGFTMVELLITLLVASVIGVSIYFVFQGQSRVFFVQETVAQIQGELRFAMESLKADLKRAGFLAALNTTTDNFWCGDKPTTPLTAIQVTDGGGFVHLPSENVNVSPDSIRLLGAFNTNNTLYTERVQGNVVTLSADPLYSPGFPTTQVDFDRLFPAGSLLRIVDSTSRYQIQRITASNYAARSITLESITRSSVGGCGPRGLGQGLLVNPVEYIRYRIVDTSNSESPGLCANSAALVGRTTLVRERLAPDGSTVLATVPIADYVVDLQFAFMVDTAPLGANPSIPVDTNPYDFQGNATAAQVNANPEQVRSVTIYLAVRTPQEDPAFPFRQRQVVTVGGNQGLGPLTSFNLDTDRSGSCRVRTLVTEVQLRNFPLSPRL